MVRIGAKVWISPEWLTLMGLGAELAMMPHEVEAVAPPEVADPSYVGVRCVELADAWVPVEEVVVDVPA